MNHFRLNNLLMIFLFVALAATMAMAASPPNIVWIIADDMSPDIAAFGAKGISTPNLDRLSTEGRRYTRAYSSAPVCSSSRSAFILGCYQTTTGLHPHDAENPQPLSSPYIPLPSLLRSAGYYVTNAPAPVSPEIAALGGRRVGKAKTHYNFSHKAADLYDSDDWRNRKPNQPFFAQFQIIEPHRAFPIPKSFDDEKLASIELPPNYPDEALTRRDWYAYQRSVEVVDAKVGLILDQLIENEVLDNTIVMFFADHGRPMPWGKQWLSIEGLRVPLIIRGPGVEPSSVQVGLVSLIDLAPTVMSVAGIEIPNWVQGEPILDATFPERDCLFAARDRCGDAADRIRAVITKDSLFVKNFYPGLSRLNWSGYKEASYPAMPLVRVLHEEKRLDPLQSQWLGEDRPEFELYHLSNDPLGWKNVAPLEENQTRVAELSKKLSEWILESEDRGADGDPASEPPLSEIQKSKRGDYQRTWKNRIGNPEPTDAERLKWWADQYGVKN